MHLNYLRGPSPHFSWYEVTKGRSPFGAWERANAIKQARAMERLRTAINRHRAARKRSETGLQVLSWYRPQWYNDQIGGARGSYHMKALACDISSQEIDRLFNWGGGRGEFDALCNYLFANGGFGQYPSGSRHVDSRGYRSRWTSWSR